MLMKIYLFSWFSLLLVMPSLGQTQSEKIIDSLKLDLTKQNDDTSRIKLLLELSATYSTVDPEIGIQYANMALKSSEKAKWKVGIARAYSRLGVNYQRKSDNENALLFHQKSLQLFTSLDDKKGMAACYHNMAGSYRENSNYTLALDYLFKALKLNELTNNKNYQLRNLTSIGNIYLDLKNNEKALIYYEKSLILSRELKELGNEALNLSNIALIHFYNKNYAVSLNFYEKAQKLFEMLGDLHQQARNESNIGLLYQEILDYSKSLYHETNSLNLHRQINNLGGIGKNYFNLAKMYLNIVINGKNGGTYFNGQSSKYNLSMASSYADSGILYFNKISDFAWLSYTYDIKSEILNQERDYKNALLTYRQYTQIKDSLFNSDIEKKLTETALQYEFDKKEALIKVENEKKELVQKNIRNAIAYGFAGSLFFLAIVYRQRNKLKIEKNRSDELLLNILPEEVAEELKQTGQANAKQFGNASVIFTDFVNFTEISEKMSPTDLVSEIHKNFTAFDAIIERNGLEKIKTIGDAYMAVCGLPNENHDHAIKAIKAAKEIRDYIAGSNSKFQIRIGINSGPVVAGIVGVKKYAYDIWGDTVNTANRMESNSEAGKINISGSTYNLVKDHFKCSYRGKISAKGKGEVDMYYLDE